ncbi:MAG: MoaD/ThiS family protein [Deltaproteobacteria bacterium]|nr:MAG: MoaD/ThiS family protein [Deltaproteobacteria bacterium]
MIIKIRAFAHLKSHLKNLSPTGDLDVPEGTTVQMILKKLQIPSDSSSIALVNGRPRSKQYKLRPGDTLVLFPPLEGG